MSRETEILKQLESEGNLRSLFHVASDGPYLYDVTVEPPKTYCNLSSNDYLGLADIDLQNEFLLGVDFDRFVMGNPASRLMTGNSAEYVELETALVELFDAEAALVLGSGYAVNSGVLPAVTRKGDLILADKLVHASMIDGLKLSDAEWRRYRHNDMEHLGSLLAKNEGKYERIVVATESLFSMDGDFAPLDQLADLQARYGFRLYLDEAHAFGVYGYQNNGAGLLAAYNARHPERPLRGDYVVVTFGKAMAGQGAAVICSRETKELLVNRMRPLIFSTALPPVSLMWTRFLIGKLPEFVPRRQKLRDLVSILEHELYPEVRCNSQIIPIVVGSNEKALSVAGEMKEAGFWVTAIRYPTVPKGEARIRISLTAAHDPAKIEEFVALCKQFG